MEKFDVITSSGGRGNAGTSPPRNRENCCRNLVLSSRGIYFRRGGRNPRNILLKIVKNSIFHRDFDQKIAEVSWKFSKFSSFWSKRANFAGRLFTFTCPMESIHQFLMILHFLQISVDFLQKFHEFSCHFQ